MEEKRNYPRFQKQYVVKLAIKDSPQKGYDLPRIIDISRGGIRFFSYEQYFLGTKLVFYFKFPFMFPNETIVEGEVVGIIKNQQVKAYQIRVKFTSTDPVSREALMKMERMNRSTNVSIKP